jgi:hypothetical protein
VTKPIGIVNAAVGNTSAASWLSKETLLQSSELKHLYPASWQVSPSTQGGPLPYLQPTAAYNHKIYPLRYLNFRGVIFSQGESNVGNEAKAHLYEISLVKLIKSWRELWNNQELIFILTTLPAAASSCPTPERLDHEAFTREAQSLVTEELPLTLSIPIHDVEATWDYGDWPYKHPIHPLNKNAVGIRLAEAAWGFAYQKTQDFVPPKMIQTETKQDAMIVTFFDQGGSLQVLPPGKSIKGFALAGADRVFYPAQARIIDGQRIEVRSPKVSSPRFVTYGFTQMNQAANLYGTKMPALPFRSDKTPGTYLRIKPFYPYEGELQPNSLGENTRSSIEKNPEATRGIFRRVIAQGQGGSITLSLTVPHDGTFDMDLLTTFSGEEGDLQVSLNSQPPVQVTPPRATAKGLREISLFRKVSLKKGVLQLKLNLVPSPSAKGAMALEIDQIRLRSECPQHLSLVKDWL